MIYDSIIVGGGPAGITAGIYAIRQKLNILLITKAFGGQIARKAVSIENYPGFEEISGPELIQKLENHLRKYEAKIEMGSVSRIEKKEDIFSVFLENGKQFQSKSVIVASGADPRNLNIPGEKEYIGKGVSYCAACDAPIFSGKEVAVIGGGNSGFEVSIALSNWAKKVYILDGGPVLRADKFSQDKAKAIGKIEIITNAVMEKIEGEKFVNSISYHDSNSKEKKTLKVEGVFIEIGYSPASSFVKDLVNLNEKGEIVIDRETGETKTPGLFAAGDVDDFSNKQIVIAAGEGARVALSAYNYLLRN